MMSEPAQSPDEPVLAAALRSLFGFHAFRPNQREIVRAVMARRDVFAVMPTGGGKSLCYQLPAHLMAGTCVVISPLIALMKDQVDAAQANGIGAEFYNSSQSAADRTRVFRKLCAGELDLLYVSPERLAMGPFLDSLKSVPLCLFAIDEAHCISEWGHDFRPDYLAMTAIVQQFPHVPVAAFTATATQRVQQDIIERLGLRQPHVVRASFDRPNLFYRVEPKESAEGQILQFIQDHPGDGGIVYRTTRRDVEATAAFLTASGISALPYHAGMDAEVRKKNQEAFSRDDVGVIVATIAFGMGIDKSNVRFVIHGDLPKNIESYYQETGRAGRDGEGAQCLLLFSHGDIPRLRFFIDKIEDAQERKIALQKLQQMTNYANLNVCRRRQLLGYFGETYEDESCGACDVCAGEVDRVEADTEAQKILSAVYRTGQRFGATHIVDVVVGADTQKIRDFKHDQIKTYGAGSDHDKRFWRRIVENLLAQGCLAQTDSDKPGLYITPKGAEVLYGRTKFFVLQQRAKHAQPQLTAAASKGKHAGKTGREEATPVEFDAGMFEQLRNLRRQLAAAKNLPPFVVFSDRTLHEMAAYFPTTDVEMHSITGVGEQKFRQYGREFLAAIAEYAQAHPEVAKRQGNPPAAPPAHRPSKKPKSGAPGTAEVTWRYVKEGLHFEKIAAKRGLAASTIIGHMEEMIRQGHSIDLDIHVPPDKQRQIRELFTQLGAPELTPVVEAAKGSVTFAEAHLVRAVMQAEV